LATRRAIHADARVGGAGEARPAADREAMAAAAEAAPVAAGALSVAALPHAIVAIANATPRRI